MGQIEALNRAFFLSVNAGPGTAAWLISGTIFIADNLIYLIPTLLLILWLWGDERKRNLALRSCLAAMLGVGANQIIGLFWQHPRPFMIELGQTWIQHAADSSFPSDHVTVLASVGITLFFAREIGLAAITLVVALCVAWSRVFLGVHFPMDMVGAVGIAVFAYVLSAPAWRRYGQAITPFVQRIYRWAMARLIAHGWIAH